MHYVMSNAVVDGSVTFLHTEPQAYKIQRLTRLLLNTAFVFLQLFLGRVWSFWMFRVVVVVMLRDSAATKRAWVLANGSTMSLICLNLIWFLTAKERRISLL